MTHPAPTAIEAAPDWAYLATVLETHADKFPVPAHILSFVGQLRARAALPVEAEAVAWEWIDYEGNPQVAHDKPPTQQEARAIYPASALTALSSQCEALRETNRDLHRRVQAVESSDSASKWKFWTRSKERWLRYYKWKYESGREERLSMGTLKTAVSRLQTQLKAAEARADRAEAALRQIAESKFVTDGWVSVLADETLESIRAITKETSNAVD